MKLLLQQWQLENDGPIFEPTAVVCSSLADEIAWLEAAITWASSYFATATSFLAHGLERLPLVDAIVADIAGIPATRRRWKKLLQAAARHERLPPVTVAFLR